MKQLLASVLPCFQQAFWQPLARAGQELIKFWQCVRSSTISGRINGSFLHRERRNIGLCPSNSGRIAKADVIDEQIVAAAAVCPARICNCIGLPA